MQNYTNYPSGSPQTPPPPPPNYLVWSILTTILCCLPFGIVAIVYSSKVNGLWFSGQYDEAYNASGKAKTWSIIAAITGLIAGGVYSGLVYFAD